MSGTFWLVMFLLIIGTVLGNFLFRLLIWRLEAGIPRQVVPDDPLREEFSTAEDFGEFLVRWGTPGDRFQLHQDWLPLHESFRTLIESYSKVDFDEIAHVFDRRYLGATYDANPEFLQIAERPDGSAVLVRVHSYDPGVYVDDIEECARGAPRLLALSLSSYMLGSWREWHSWKEGDRDGNGASIRERRT